MFEVVSLNNNCHRTYFNIASTDILAQESKICYPSYLTEEIPQVCHSCAVGMPKCFIVASTSGDWQPEIKNQNICDIALNTQGVCENRVLISYFMSRNRLLYHGVGSFSSQNFVGLRYCHAWISAIIFVFVFCLTILSSTLIFFRR